MSSQSIVCGTCSATVPYGRLSCPACGELLASVAGAPRRPSLQRAPKRAARTSRATTATAVAPAVPATTATQVVSSAPVMAATPSVLVDVAPPTTPATAATAAMPYELGSSGWDAPAPTTAVDDEPQWPADLPATPFAAARAPAVESPHNGTSLPSVLTPVAPEAGASAPGDQMAAFSPPSIADAPGAYVPPAIPAVPAGPPAPARAWAGHPGTDELTPDSGTPSTTSDGPLMDAARLPEFVGWLAVAGSAMAAVGFVLPWGISVIGGSGVGYFDRWGLAGPFHPIVLLALLSMLGLAMVRNPIPLWVRVGVPGIGLGALLLGLVWPYLFYLPGTGPGVLVVAVGALTLVVAGIVALVADRHVGEDRAV